MEVSQKPISYSNDAVDETDFQAALTAARMGAWETDLVSRTRKWSPEAMKLFGLELPGGIGTVGGEADEYMAALHSDDRHFVAYFRAVADVQDFYEGDYRIVRPDGTVRWVTGRALVVERGRDGKALRTVTVVTDITEQKQAEEHVRFLLGELSHRSKNLITVIGAIAHRTARTSDSLEDFEQRFARRLTALSRSQHALAGENWKAAPLDLLVREQLSFLDEGAERIHIRGPQVLLSALGVQIIGLAVHELATNAIKHGSLSSPLGRVDVAWNFAHGKGDADILHVTWSESNGPRIVAPERAGFGYTVIRDMVTRQLGARVQIDFPPHGMIWIAEIPLRSLMIANDGVGRATSA
jgi:PAS domain S-box-containing protein